MADKNVIYNAEVKVELDSKELKKGVKEAKKEAKKLEDEKVKVDVDEKQADGFLKKLKKMRDGLRSFAFDAKTNAGLIKMTPQAKELYTNWLAATKSVEQYKAALEKAEATDPDSDYAEELRDALARAEYEAQELAADLKAMPTFGKLGLFEDTAQPSFVKNMRAYMTELRTRATMAARGFRDGFVEAADEAGMRFPKRMRDIIRSVNEATTSVRRFAKGIRNDLVRVGRAAIGKLSAKFNELRGNIGLSTFGLKGFKKGMLSAVGIKGIARLGLLTAALYTVGRGAREGMGNLSQYSASTRNSLESLKASLLTMKNSFATAFAPLLSVVVPALQKVIGWVTAAATAIAHFTAALTGKSSVVVAKPITSVADSASDAAGATDAANDSAKEYKRTLMGFDQINKLEDPTSDSGGGAGGGGGGSAGGGVSDMFETVEVSDKMKGLAEQIKQAWRDADFTELGEMLGEKLNSALANIPWDKIQETARKLAKSIATFLNGFIATTDWTLVGKTFAEGINTVIEFAYTFVTTFDWKNFGKAIGDAVNGFFKNVDFAKAGQAFSAGVKGLLDTAITAISTIDWEDIGHKVVQFLTNIDWIGILTKAATLIAKLVKGFGDLLKGAIEEGIKGVKNWLDSGHAMDDLLNFGKAVLDIGANLVGAGWDIIKALAGGVFDIVAKIASVAVDKVKGLALDATAKFTDWVKGSKFASTVGGMVSKFTSFIKGFHGGTVSGMVSRLTSFVKGWRGGVISHMTAKFTSWKKKFKDMTISGFTAKITKWITSKKKPTVNAGSMHADGGVFKSGRWKPITAAANGGEFNTGQLFVAREAGAELVGTIGNNTAVMNNDQIVASVSAGVARAVAAVMGGMNNSTNVTIEGDMAGLFRAVRTEAARYTQATGRPAFPV